VAADGSVSIFTGALRFRLASTSVVDLSAHTAPGLRERKKLRTRATLIDAAVDLCGRQGFDRTTVDQIAANADVSPRTFSRYFVTKDAVALAMIDEVLDVVAAELAAQPPELSIFEALKRAYLQMAYRAFEGASGAVSAERFLQIVQILVSSRPLQQSALDFRGNPVDVAVAARLGTPVDDRRVKLVAGVFNGVLVTAVCALPAHPQELAELGVDGVIATFEAVYADFLAEVAGLGQHL
jgi:AcrR family transcriptional regulator